MIHELEPVKVVSGHYSLPGATFVFEYRTTRKVMYGLMEADQVNLWEAWAKTCKRSTMIVLSKSQFPTGSYVFKVTKQRVDGNLAQMRQFLIEKIKEIECAEAI